MDFPSWQACAPFVVLSLHAGFIAMFVGQFDERVPEPYMDEIFHIPQAQAYCEGRWTHWDPKITTPPGIYLPVAIGHHILPRWIPCSVTALRSTNALLLFCLPFLIFRILGHFRAYPYPPRSGAKLKVRFLIPDDALMVEAVAISAFPLAYFSGFLFYTELASLCSVLACYDLSLRGRHWLAGMVGFASLWTRQTNVVWVAFIAGAALCSSFKSDIRPAQAVGGLHDPPLIHASLVDVPRASYSLTSGCVRNFGHLLPIALPYAFVAVAFLAYLHWNGAIVLGDKANHVANLHLPQLFYFAAFSAAFSAPLLVDKEALRQSVRGFVGSWRRCICTVLALSVSLAVVHRYTQAYAHPFILADNRHYIFYVWRRIIDRHWLVRYTLVPGYLVAGRLLWERLARSYTLTLLPTAFYLVALAATLVPSPLLEPRYFLTPYILLRVHFRPLTFEYSAWPVRLALEWSVYALVNLVTIWVFLFRPFKTPPGQWPGEWQRFMW